MHEVTCFRCEHAVGITPDAETCSVCGENLHELLPPDYVSSYFYERATALAIKHGAAVALVEAQRGLEYQLSSELLLLAAILANQQGHYNLMRHCVSAIPMDDTLRPEGEWLLRAHQAGQRALREGIRGQTHAAPLALPDLSSEPFVTSPLSVAVVRGPQPRAGWVTPVAALLLLGVLGLVVWVTSPMLLGLSGLVSALTDSPTVESLSIENAIGEDVSSDAPAGEPAVTTNDEPALEDTPRLDGAVDNADEDNNGDARQDEVAPAGEDGRELDTAPNERAPSDGVPENGVPADVAQAPTRPALVTTNDRTAALLADSTPYNLQGFLRGLGRPDLAALPIEAVLRKDQLVLAGNVEFPAQREALLELAAAAPGIADVSSVDVQVRLPPTYTVEEGDTLWVIAFKLFEDGPRWQDLYDYNRNVLATPDSIRVGQVLQVPPQK